MIETSAFSDSDAAARILDLARWAPSGDNMQTWRFEIVDHNHITVRCQDTRDHCVYDLEGHATQIALGTLFETLSIAATRYGMQADFSPLEDSTPSGMSFDIRLAKDSGVKPSLLLDAIERRATQRRAMSPRRLTEEQKLALESALGADFEVIWIESWRAKWQMARLLFLNAEVRLTMPEAYATHSTIIEWDATFSEDRIPDRAIGLDPVATRLMRWALGSWERVVFLNRYLAGTLLPRVELDLLPGVACGAHFILVARRPLDSRDDYILAGRAWQRLWLTATHLGLWAQPEMTPIIFGEYVRRAIPFTRDPRVHALATCLESRFSDLIGREAAERSAVMGRIGRGPAPKARSTRLPLAKLMSRPSDGNH